jgi:glycogen(starch) synthase
MRVLMLGWEFPPFISGGLGTACYGLTKALDRMGHEVVFILPKAVDRSRSTHIKVLGPEQISRSRVKSVAGMGGLGPPVSWLRPVIRADGSASRGHGEAMGELAPVAGTPLGLFSSYTIEGFEHTTFRGVPASFASPYPAFASRTASAGSGTSESGGAGGPGAAPGAGSHRAELAEAAELGMDAGGGGGPAGYEGDMLINAERYARLVVALARTEKYDVIHAHDWMTFPAGQYLAQISGRPLVVHVHSTEFDRAGEGANQRVYDIERRGMHAALRVVAVSNLTSSICQRRYGVDISKIDVVWNGIDADTEQPPAGAAIASRDRIVLFLGRITMQKGPEYFVRAAKRVLEKIDNVKFVMAGSGDMWTRTIEEAAALGIGHKFTWPGFLRGADVDRAFQMADCYVMPSVSEPFGIAPLEAMRNDVPVIISKQSGVSEALTHALKVDFWDIDEMANMIVAVLRHPPLGETLREHGAFELRKLTWDGAASKCVKAYEKAIAAQGRAVAVRR